MKHVKLLALSLILAIFGTTVLHAEVSMTEFEAMKKEMNDMRMKMDGMRGAEAPLTSVTDRAAEAAPAANPVTTASGKLVMGGLIQVWYTAPQKDKKGLFNSATVADSNQPFNKNTFSIHTVELYFDMAITDNVSGFVYINPAAEIPSNTRPILRKTLAQQSPEFAAGGGAGAIPAGTGSTLGGTQGLQGTGSFAGGTPSLLQDAIINFHGIVPHHDFTVGQMLNTFNEENFAANNSLDFVDRSYIGNQVSRDTGAVIHGSWWCNGGGGSYAGAGDTGRFQYWLGVWDGAGSLYGSAINRQDDNNNKDFVGTMLVRPIWNDCLGKLELGYSYRAGKKGGDGSVTAPVNGLERQHSFSQGHDGWAKYYAPGALKGLWLKGEAEWIRDRNLPGSVIDQATPGVQTGAFGQAEPFSSFGYWAAIGYKFGDSSLFGGGCQSCHSNNFWKNFEVDFRYENAPNVQVQNAAEAQHTNVYHTNVYTGGINYYIAGQGAKIQLNYNSLKNPTGGPVAASTHLHNTNDNSLVVNFQVSW